MSKKSENEDISQSDQVKETSGYYSVLNYWSDVMTATNQSLMTGNLQLLNAGKNFFPSAISDKAGKLTQQNKEKTTKAKPQNIELENSGSASKKFFGHLIIIAQNYDKTIAPWYQISVYNKASKGYVIQIVTYAHDNKSMSRCFDCETTSDLFETIETYDVLHAFEQQDLHVEQGKASCDVLTVLNIKLAQKAAQDNYLTVVGDILYELEGLLQE